MSSYLMKYKGKYRIRANYDLRTNQFPKKLNGNFEDIDIYIDAQKGGKIFHYGGRILQYYTPSLKRGRNIIKAIEQELGEEIISNIEESDSEVLFRFNSKYMEQLESYLKPKTSGANISPFSSRNLPIDKTYKIQDEDLLSYKEIIKDLPRNQLILLGKYTNSFLQSLTTKKNTWENIKADMALKGLKGKEYIHSIGKWKEYVKYLAQSLKQIGD